MTLTPATYSTSRHEAIILKTGNQALPDISLEIYAETIPYYSIKLLDHSIYDMCDGDERTIPVVAKVYTPDKDETSINLRCDDDYLTIRQDAPEVRKYSEELYEITVTGEITIRCDLTKVKPPITHNSIRLEYLGETRYRADVIWCPKSSCSVFSREPLLQYGQAHSANNRNRDGESFVVDDFFCKDDFIELTGEIDELPLPIPSPPFSFPGNCRKETGNAESRSRFISTTRRGPRRSFLFVSIFHEQALNERKR